MNLYGMVGNDPVNRLDYLGLANIQLEMKSLQLQKGNCGAVRWDVQFTAKNLPEGFTGKLIQNVQFRVVVLPCDGAKTPFSLDKGTADALGMTYSQKMRKVVLPQAFRVIIPPTGNEFIAILKDTSLLSILSIRDLTQRMREFQSATFLTFAPYNTVAIVYVFLTLIAASLVARIEHRYRTHRH